VHSKYRSSELLHSFLVIDNSTSSSSASPSISRVGLEIVEFEGGRLESIGRFECKIPGPDSGISCENGLGEMFLVRDRVLGITGG
jgi:hypothetical protein